MSTENPDRFTELIARGLAQVDADAFREIIAQVIRDRLVHRECAKMIELAVTPVVRELVKEMVKEPEVLKSIEARVRAQLHALANSITLGTWRY